MILLMRAWTYFIIRSTRSVRSFGFATSRSYTDAGQQVDNARERDMPTWIYMQSQSGRKVASTIHPKTHYFFFAAMVLPRRPLYPLSAAISLGTGKNLRGLGVLTPNPQTPVVSQPPVRSDLLQSLEIITHLLVDGVGEDVAGFTVGEITLPVEEPRWDFELSGVLHDGDDSLELIGVEFTGTGYEHQRVSVDKDCGGRAAWV
jgi:hypothetical protein